MGGRGLIAGYCLSLLGEFVVHQSLVLNFRVFREGSMGHSPPCYSFFTFVDNKYEFFVGKLLIQFVGLVGFWTLEGGYMLWGYGYGSQGFVALMNFWQVRVLGVSVIINRSY